MPEGVCFSYTCDFTLLSGDFIRSPPFALHVRTHSVGSDFAQCSLFCVVYIHVNADQYIMNKIDSNPQTVSPLLEHLLVSIPWFGQKPCDWTNVTHVTMKILNH